MKRSVKVFLILTLTLATAGVCAAQGPDGERRVGPRRGPEVGQGAILKRLGLTQEQLDRIREINKQKRSAVVQAQLALGAANRKLDAAIYSEGADAARVESLMIEVRDAQHELLKLRTSLELEIGKVLTRDQLNLFRQMRQRIGGREEQRIGPGPGRRPGPQRPMRPGGGWRRPERQGAPKPTPSKQTI